ncbi:MAG: DUF1761 domain-containing protein [Saprospiraceae bacterium]|nr:DUF1761 domain-containing protein [Saprospiraceae bacterium]
MNFLIVLVAGLVPALLGMIWYHPSLFGKAWQNEVGHTDEKVAAMRSKMMLNMVIMIVFSIFIAFMLMPIVNHQWGVFSLLENQPGMHDDPPSNPDFKMMMDKYGTNFRSFGHGALHGLITGLLFVFPLIRLTTLWEGKSWKFVFIQAGYWILSLILMGGIICQWA